MTKIKTGSHFTKAPSTSRPVARCVASSLNYSILALCSVAILPNGLDPKVAHKPEDYWIGRIHDIRGLEHSDNTNTVCCFLFAWPILTTEIKDDRFGYVSSGTTLAKMPRSC